MSLQMLSRSDHISGWNSLFVELISSNLFLKIIHCHKCYQLSCLQPSHIVHRIKESGMVQGFQRISRQVHPKPQYILYASLMVGHRMNSLVYSHGFNHAQGTWSDPIIHMHWLPHYRCLSYGSVAQLMGCRGQLHNEYKHVAIKCRKRVRRAKAQNQVVLARDVKKTKRRFTLKKKKTAPTKPA